MEHEIGPTAVNVRTQSLTEIKYSRRQRCFGEPNPRALLSNPAEELRADLNQRGPPLCGHILKVL
jgi:hypothetical protein